MIPKILLILLFAISIQFSFAQTYKPLLKENKYWDVLTYVGFENNPICGYGGGSRYFLNGDTIINGKEYKKIYSYGFIPQDTTLPYFCPPYNVDTNATLSNHFIREDTTERKIFYYNQYIIDNTTCYDSSSSGILLYDFNYQVGDTLKCYTASFGDCYYDWVVDSVKYEDINGIIRKVIYFYYGAGMIEGIGGSEMGGGLFQPILLFEAGYTLECVIDNENVIYGGDCADYITQINNIEYKNKKIKIYPNPYHSSTKISYNLSDNFDMLIEIYNLTGKKIHTLVNENQDKGSYQYNFSAKELGYSSGIYILKIKYNDEIFSFKLVKF